MRVVVFSHIRLFGETLTSCLMQKNRKIEATFCHLAENLVRDINSFEADIVLVDVSSNRALCEAKAAYLSCRTALFVALAVPEIPQEVIACADVGFVAYVPKTAPLEELFQLMEMAQKGECIGDPKIVGSLLREIRRRGDRAELVNGGKFLTHRECEVLNLLSQGLSNKAIASRLGVSLSTVKNHLHNAFSKLGVGCRAEALFRIRNEPWLAQNTTNARIYP